MNTERIRRAYDEDERRQAFEPTARWITAGGYAAFWSPVYRAGWTLQPPPDDPRAISALRDAVRDAVRGGSAPDGGAAPDDAASPGEFEWKCFSWDGPEPWYADGALRAAGFVSEGDEAVVVADAATLAADDSAGNATLAGGCRAPATTAYETTPAASLSHEGITVRVATKAALDAAGILADADAVNRAVWDESTRPSTIAGGYWSGTGTEAGTGAPHLSIHVAYLGGQPVSYGRFQITPGSRFGGLWGGATVPEARGRGCYRALVASRAAEARTRGLTWLMVDANPVTSYPILRRLGFDLLGYTRPYAFSLGAE
jgi:GNAT superfamily N-acetyltransferase